MPPQIPARELRRVGKIIAPYKGYLLSPLDSRYTDWEGIEPPHPVQYMTPEAQHGYRLAVLRAYNHVLGEHDAIPKGVARTLVRGLKRNKIPFIEADQQEKITRHDIRGFVRAAQQTLPKDVAHWLYLALTSYDIINTAYSLGLRDLAYELMGPESIRFARTLVRRAREEKDTVMMGRTHLQHAVATSAGHWLGEIAQGLIPPMEAYLDSADNLRGKISGFVGTRAAQQFLFGDYVDPRDLEEETLELLHLKPDEFTSQIVHQTFYAPHFAHLVSIAGNTTKFTEDVRNYQQTEVGEIYERKLSERVGSSTGAHKANPIDSENVSGHWPEIMPRLLSVYADFITDFQRDLRPSSNMRYYMSEVPTLAYLMIKRAADIAEAMTIRRERMAQNLGITKGLIIAEPLQLAMQRYCAEHGIDEDTHEYTRRLASRAVEGGLYFTDVMTEDPLVQQVLASLSEEKKEILMNPEKYLGTAVEDIERNTKRWDSQLSDLEARIQKHNEVVSYI